VNFNGVSQPSDKDFETKLGLDFANNKVKAKWQINPRNYLSEVTLAYRQNPRWLFGSNFTFDAKKSTFPTYHAGVVFEPSDNALVGLKHESLNKDKHELGKFFLFYFHKASLANTVGSEFSFDYQKKVVEAKLGLSHKFDDNTSGKIKVNNNGTVDALLKHKLSEVVTASVVTSVNVKDFANQKSRSPLPLGIAFDLKL
jgi:hypothetical protein